jgi:hypothetical protein
MSGHVRIRGRICIVQVPNPQNIHNDMNHNVSNLIPNDFLNVPKAETEIMMLVSISLI